MLTYEAQILKNGDVSVSDTDTPQPKIYILIPTEYRN